MGRFTAKRVLPPPFHFKSCLEKECAPLFPLGTCEEAERQERTFPDWAGT